VIALGDVPEGRLLTVGRVVFDRIPVELEEMPVGIGETIGAAVAEIAVGPADAVAGGFDCFDAARQGLGEDTR
jgi:hypothetical protein